MEYRRAMRAEGLSGVAAREARRGIFLGGRRAKGTEKFPETSYGYGGTTGYGWGVLPGP